MVPHEVGGAKEGEVLWEVAVVNPLLPLKLRHVDYYPVEPTCWRFGKAQLLIDVNLS